MENSKHKRIDCHVHIVGNGSSGSGCWLRLGGRFTVQARIIVREFGLPQSALRGDLDNLYVERLVSMLRESSLDAAVILAQDVTRDEAGNAIEGFGAIYVPNDYVLGLSKKYPEFLPGVSIHPARRDAIEELEKCLQGGAALMKALPNCLNFNPSDPRFTKFWERMAEAGLPFLAHTGGEFSMPVYNHRYEDPALLKLPLEIGVKVIGAHCGTPSLYFDKNYTDVFAEMLCQYPNFWGDNSGMLTPVRSRHFQKILCEPYLSRIVYGSDIPIPISGLWAFLRGLISWKDYLHSRKEKNIFERDILIKRAMGFPEETWTRCGELIRMVS